MSSPTRAGTRIAGRDVRHRDAHLLAGRSASRRPDVSAIVCGSSDRRAELAQRRGEDRVARDHAAELRVCSSCRTRATASAADTSVCSSGSGATVRPCSWRIRHSSRKPKPRPPTTLGQRDAEQVRLGELGPRVAVEPVRRCRRARAGAPSVHAVGEDLAGQALELVLLFGEGEVHRRSPVSRRHSAGEPGMLRPKMAMRSRCISLVPPPKVRMCMLRVRASSRPLSTDFGRAELHRRRRAEDLHEEPERLQVELGAEHLDRRRVRRVRAAHPARAGRRPASSRGLQELEPGVHPGQVELHPLLVDHARAVGELRAPRPTRSCPRAGARRRRSRRA